MKTQIYFLSMLFFLTVSVKSANAHCEIPCGIFTDSLRIELIAEHITTIEKSMKKIEELSQEDDEDYHTIIRWTINKEEHAKKIQEIVAHYFMHQRIKPVEKTSSAYNIYLKQLTLAHQLQILAMKCKQTTDLEYIEKLRTTLSDFSHTYFHKH